MLHKEIGVCGSGKTAEGTVTMNTPSHTPFLSAETCLEVAPLNSPPYGINLRECNSPNLWTPCYPTLQNSCPLEESATWARVYTSVQTLGVSVTELCGLGVGAIPLTFP